MDIDKEELKSETKETVDQVKENLKNVDINKEAKETKGFLTEMLVSPFEKVSKIANEEEDAFKKSIILMILNIAAVVIIEIIGLFKYSYGSIGSRIWDLVLAVISPIVAILVPAILILLMNKSNKKSLTTILATLITARTPLIIYAVIRIISTLFSKILLITSPIGTMLSAVAILLEYTGMRQLFGEEKETFLIPKYVSIKFITALVLYII